MTTDEYHVRRATEADLPVLVRIKPPLAMHRDRLGDAADEYLVYAVVEQRGDVVGYGLLVFERPPYWGDAGDRSRLPCVVDLLIKPECRSQGAGSCLLAWMEDLAYARGHSRLYLGVDPIENPRAQELYLRLGYRPLETQPVWAPWRFTDSDGNTHEGAGWSVDMVKALGPEAPDS